MELYKVPAGRLATIFYKSPRRHFSQISTLDSEKGTLDEDIPPVSQHGVLIQPTLQDGVRKGRTLVWRNVSLELKLKDGKRTLLDSLNGKTLEV